MSQAYVTADLRHHPADEHRRASEVALIDVAHWASEYPWCEQAADVLRSAFGAALSVRVCPIRTDPWNVDNVSGGEDDESRSRATTLAARSCRAGRRAVQDGTTAPATCPSAKTSSGYKPSRSRPTTGLSALQIALEDLDTQVSRFESEIDGVRQREDRDRSLLQSVADSKQLSELQHELETLQRRQSSLEDSLLEVMEHREQLQAQRTAEQAVIEGLQADLAAAQQALDTTLADIDHARRAPLVAA